MCKTPEHRVYQGAAPLDAAGPGVGDLDGRHEQSGLDWRSEERFQNESLGSAKL
jgi:hypothetical protein